jgi:hypothetical protein
MLFGHSLLPGANDRTWPNCDLREGQMTTLTPKTQSGLPPGLNAGRTIFRGRRRGLPDRIQPADVTGSCTPSLTVSCSAGRMISSSSQSSDQPTTV